MYSRNLKGMQADSGSKTQESNLDFSTFKLLDFAPMFRLLNSSISMNAFSKSGGGLRFLALSIAACRIKLLEAFLLSGRFGFCSWNLTMLLSIAINTCFSSRANRS